MKTLVVLAFLFAIIAAGFLVATVFTTGSTMVYASLSAGLALAAFIILYVAYTSKTPK